MIIFERINMVNNTLNAAKIAKNDEFYTQYEDVKKEIENYIEYDPDIFKDKTVLLPCDDYEWSNFTKYFVDNFERLGLKKLISTSYAKSAGSNDTHGKLFIITSNNDKLSGYLKGDGDFRSEEVTALRDKADIVITNPPFSLFSEFLTWVVDANKKFIILGNMNAITYKDVFPLFNDNKIWLGTTAPKEFIVPSWTTKRKNVYIREDGTAIAKFGNICWFTNVDHGLRHQPLLLNTMEYNLEFNKELRKKFNKSYGVIEYPHYDNYDAIEVPFVNAIPSDYNGVMGVPITFMNKYNPEQFEIVGTSEVKGFSHGLWNQDSNVTKAMIGNNILFKRIFIQLKKETDND